MIAPDGDEIAVAAEHHDFQFGIRQFEARRKGNGATMRGMK